MVFTDSAAERVRSNCDLFVYCALLMEAMVFL